MTYENLSYCVVVSSILGIMTRNFDTEESAVQFARKAKSDHEKAGIIAEISVGRSSVCVDWE